MFLIQGHKWVEKQQLQYMQENHVSHFIIHNMSYINLPNVYTQHTLKPQSTDEIHVTIISSHIQTALEVVTPFIFFWGLFQFI
jgi:hypothetical protein